jgi:Haloacid Dehalogenase superfamily, subfamily IB, phosphoserine phosphatase-like/2,3-diketo-5-methylthio-1-phosphopentane phosphatase
MADELSYIVFTDFDGTITHNDIGDTMFKVFGNPEESAMAFRESNEGRIGVQESWRRSCATVELLSRNAFESFVELQEIDAGFHSFERYCSEKSIPVNILSDGFDLYIRHVLQREQLGHLPFYSNELTIEPDGTISPRFPYSDAECMRCANCKRNHLLTKSSDESVIVYIGNGRSDQCPSRYADVVFAKGSLLRYCEQENITYHRFETFDDVLAKFKTIVERGRPRKHRTAELARKEIFMQG